MYFTSRTLSGPGFIAIDVWLRPPLYFIYTMKMRKFHWKWPEHGPEILYTYIPIGSTSSSHIHDLSESPAPLVAPMRYCCGPENLWKIINNTIRAGPSSRMHVICGGPVLLAILIAILRHDLGRWSGYVIDGPHEITDHHLHCPF